MGGGVEKSQGEGMDVKNKNKNGGKVGGGGGVEKSQGEGESM